MSSVASSGARISVDYVHLHAVDDGVEILAPEPEIAHWRLQAQRARDWLAGIERIDIGAPALESLPALGAGTAGIRDVIDLTAKGVDLEHCLALRAAAARASRYKTSCPTPARPQPCLKLLPTPTLTHPVVCGRPRTGGRRGGSSPHNKPEKAEARDPRLAEMDSLAQRIASAQQFDQALCQGLNDSNLQSESRVPRSPAKTACSQRRRPPVRRASLWMQWRERGRSAVAPSALPVHRPRQRTSSGM